MGKRLTASEETQLLQQTIREAHEATQALNDAIKQALAIAPALVADFERTHEREVQLLSNHFQEEINRQAAQINESTRVARDYVLEQLAKCRPVFDTLAGTVTLVFPSDKIDDQVPLPYPDISPKGSTS